MIYKILGNVKDLLLPGSIGVLTFYVFFPVFYNGTLSFLLTLVFPSVAIFTSLTFLDYKRYRSRPIFECFLTVLPFILYLSVFLLESLGVNTGYYIDKYDNTGFGIGLILTWFLTQFIVHGLIVSRNAFFIKRNAKLHGTLLTSHLIVIFTLLFLGYLLL